MDINEAMAARHAVRDYSDRPIDEATLSELNKAIARANADGGLDIQLVHDDEDAFGGCPTHYGRFKNVRYCMALIGSDNADGSDGSDGETRPGLDERVGYYGQRLALEAVRLGLDTSWVVLHGTESHGKWTIPDGGRMPAAIVIGYGNRPGRPHRSKPIEELGAVENGTIAEAPAWFARGLEAAQLAPSALGKQPFRFTLLADGRTVRAEMLEGLQPEIGLGIARLHFELGATNGDESAPLPFVWA